MDTNVEDLPKVVVDSPVKLLAATDGDYHYSFELYRSSLRKYFEETVGWDETFRRAAFRVSYPPAQCKTITVGDAPEPRGVLCLQPREESAIEVALLLVDPAFQNTGIGKHILLRVCDDASRAHLGVWLQTFKLNENATRFYLRMGFHVVGEDEHYWNFRRSADEMLVRCRAGRLEAAHLTYT